jgi:predicted GIY-YIG superfamily endonuclease
VNAVVYTMRDAAGDVVYVGCTTRLDVRLGQHRNTKDFWREVATISLEHFDTWDEAYAAEQRLIDELRPPNNADRSRSARQAWETRKAKQEAAHSQGRRCFDAGCRCRGVEVAS